MFSLFALLTEYQYHAESKRRLLPLLSLGLAVNAP